MVQEFTLEFGALPRPGDELDLAAGGRDLCRRTGLEIDLVKGIGRALGIEMRPVVLTSANRVVCLLTWFADILIHSRTIVASDGAFSVMAFSSAESFEAQIFMPERSGKSLIALSFGALTQYDRPA